MNHQYLNEYEKERIKELEEKIHHSDSVSEIELYKEQVGLIIMKSIYRYQENKRKEEELKDKRKER